jgi:hypothetical protein
VKPLPPTAQSLITIDLREKTAAAATVGFCAQLAARLTGMSNGLKDRARTAKAYFITARMLPLESSPVPLPGTADPARRPRCIYVIAHGLRSRVRRFESCWGRS